jgi:hypothetical protein
MTGLMDDSTTTFGALSSDDFLLARRLLRRWDVLEPRLRSERRLWNAAVRLLERYAADVRRRIDEARSDFNGTNEVG